MLKKLSLLLAAVALCVNTGIVAPVSAQAATEETVLVQSNFQNCNLGTYTAANQMNGETDLRNGVVMNNDSNLSTGYTIKNGDSYEGISEADIVDDGGEKVLRLNTFLSTSYDVNAIDSYPVVKSTGRIPKNGKVRIDLELKMSPRVSFYMNHSKPVEEKWRIWKLENGGGSASNIRVLNDTILANNKQAICNVYNTFTVIMDTATAKMDFYLKGELLGTVTGRLPAKNKELFFNHVTNTADDYKPIVNYDDKDSKKIGSVKNPQYVYVKSLKMTTYTDTTLESATPADGSSVMTPKEAVFTFNKEIKSVKKAEVYGSNSGEPVDVTESLIIDGKTVKVPYAFEDEKNYEVKLTGASDGLTLADATTSFRAEEWKFSNIIENPTNASPEDNNKYFIDEDFTNSEHDDINNVICADGWTVRYSQDATIAQLEDGNKVYQVETTGEAKFQLEYNKSGIFDDTTTLSFDLYREEGTRNFIIERNDFTTVNTYPLVASWFTGYCNGKELTAGKWHKFVITFSDTAGTSVYVDGILVLNTPKAAEHKGLKATNTFRFRTVAGKVKIDNFKLYLNRNKTELTSVAPAYDAMDVKVTEPLVFTYNELIGDVSDAKLIVKPNDSNEATVLTNGNGMSVSPEGNKVKITLDEALKENTGYALEFSGIKNTAELAVEAIKTRFSTVYDPAWDVKDFESTVQSASSKKYSIKVKNETDAEGARMAVAVYDENGNLKDVGFSEPALSSDGWVELNATVNYTQGNTSKIFIWDSLEDMNLICGIISD